MNEGTPNPRQRVLWLIKGLGPGGAERLLVSASVVRDREAFDYEVAYLLPWKDRLVPDLEREGVQSHCLHVRHVADLRWVFRLRRLILERRYDVLHVHSPYPAGVARLVVRTLPQAVRPGVVSTEHNVWSSHSPLTRLLNRLTFSLGDAWLVVSDEVRRSISPRHRRRVEIVVHGVVIADCIERLALRDEARAELGLQPDEVVVGTVANFRAQKAYPDLLQAARKVAHRDLPIRFVAIGQGPLEQQIRTLHRALGLEASVSLLGYHPDPLRVLAACDLFVLTSHYEGYPVAIMEALAMGLPVVATAVGGVPEAVHEGVEGYLIPPGRPDLIADAVIRLATDPDRRARMAAAALRRGRQYDISDAVRRTEEIYLEIAAGARRGSGVPTTSEPTGLFRSLRRVSDS